MHIEKKTILAIGVRRTLAAGTHFTCCTSAKVQILPQKALPAAKGGGAVGRAGTPFFYTQFTCFTGTGVPILTRRRSSRAGGVEDAAAGGVSLSLRLTYADVCGRMLTYCL